MENQLKRRASFIDSRRKSLTFTNIFVDENEAGTSIESPKHSIKSYLDLLTKEKQDWEGILKEKKMKFKNSEKKFKYEPLTISRPDVEKFLTPEDKEFLEKKPNYLAMVNSLRTYIDGINYLNKYKSNIIDYYKKACSELENDKKVLVEGMCADDLCNICNTKNCNKQEHKFSI